MAQWSANPARVLLVESGLLVELKTIKELDDVHRMQCTLLSGR
jgi:hypothetical protein